jgi:hypothetical protein
MTVADDIRGLADRIVTWPEGIRELDEDSFPWDGSPGG